MEQLHNLHIDRYELTSHVWERLQEAIADGMPARVSWLDGVEARLIAVGSDDWDVVIVPADDPVDTSVLRRVGVQFVTSPYDYASRVAVALLSPNPPRGLSVEWGDSSVPFGDEHLLGRAIRKGLEAYESWASHAAHGYAPEEENDPDVLANWILSKWDGDEPCPWRSEGGTLTHYGEPV